MFNRYYFIKSTKSYDVEMHVCTNCGCEFSYDAETGITGDDYNYCPFCGKPLKETSHGCTCTDCANSCYTGTFENCKYYIKRE